MQDGFVDLTARTPGDKSKKDYRVVFAVDAHECHSFVVSNCIVEMKQLIAQIIFISLLFGSGTFCICLHVTSHHGGLIIGNMFLWHGHASHGMFTTCPFTR